MSAPDPPAPPPPGIPEEAWWKNRLQQYAQRASMQLPVYETFNEGAQNVPQFRSRVWVDEICFMSPNTFSNRKMAEQDAAKHALIGIREKVKSEVYPFILEDTVFCKTIANEYALKMNMKAPIYVTNESKAVLPIFVSSLILNDVTFTGEAGKNKKEAEQFAARSAILSILDSESGTTMSEIVKSKFKFYSALKKVKDLSSVQGGTVPAGVNLETGALLSFNKRKEVEVIGEQPSSTPATYQSLHEFKKAKPETSLAAIAPPIVFVPPASEQPPMCSTSAKKQNRKKKKGKKKVENQSLLTDAVMPQTVLPACSVAQ